MEYSSLVLAAVSFVGSHFLLSHPLRRPLAGALGEVGFLVVYSVVAVATLGWMAAAYATAPTSAFLWPVGDALWALATALMLIASILLMGSLIGNPALPTGGRPGAPPEEARGVFAITRHPMMWSFAIWSACHVAVYPVTKNVIVAAAVALLALVGAALQDRKKERRQPEAWPAWERRTSYVPFAAIAAGRARLGGFRAHALAGGVIVWLAATWAHIPISGWPAGIWRWI